MENCNIFFVAGIHGVGKSTICNKVAQRLNIFTSSSSQIIKEYKGKKITNSGKRVKNIDENQEALLLGLQKIEAKNILLDGHFVLMNAHGDIEKITESIFQKIRPTAIILLIDTPAEIAKRLESRDCIQYSEKILSQMQDLEERQAVQIAKLISASYLKIDLQADIEPDNTLSSFVSRNI